MRCVVCVTEIRETIFYDWGDIVDLYELGRLMTNEGMRPEEVLSLSKFDVQLERASANLEREISSRAAPSRSDAGQPRDPDRENVWSGDMNFHGTTQTGPQHRQVEQFS